MNGIACIGTIDDKQHVGVRLVRFLTWGMVFWARISSCIGVGSWVCSIVGGE
jgi:hypothetical protein